MALQMCVNGRPHLSLKRQVSWKMRSRLLTLFLLRCFVPLSPTHGVANNVERYSVKPGPHVRASRPPTQPVASKWPIPPTYPLRSCDTATSVSWHVAACPVHSDGVVILPSYHERSCPPARCLTKITSTRSVPRPTVTGQRRIVGFQINCGTIPQQRRPPYHAMHCEQFQSVRDRPV